MKTDRREPAFPIAEAPPASQRPGPDLPGISTAPDCCRLQGRTLTVAPFRIERHGQTYNSATEFRIDLGAVEPGRYRVIAVHNFHVEDRNPRLDECVAGVFLAAQRSDGRWEEPERFPVECRALQMLALIDVPAGVRLPKQIAP